MVVDRVGNLNPMLKAPFHQDFILGHQIQQSLALAHPFVRAKLVQVLPGGNDGVKKLD